MLDAVTDVIITNNLRTTNKATTLPIATLPIATLPTTTLPTTTKLKISTTSNILSNSTIAIRDQCQPSPCVNSGTCLNDQFDNKKI